MSPFVFQRALRAVPLWALSAALVLLLGCASAPATDVATQRFEAAFHAGRDKFAAGDLPAAATAFAQADDALAAARLQLSSPQHPAGGN